MNRPIRILAPLLLLGAALLLVACGQAAGDTPTPSQSAGTLPPNTALPPAPTDTAAAPAATAVPPTDTAAAPTMTAAPPTATVGTLATVTTLPPTVAPQPPTIVATRVPPTVAATHPPVPPTHLAAAPSSTPTRLTVIVGTSVAGGPITSPPLRDITPEPPGGAAVTVTAAANGEATLDLPPPNRPTVLLQIGQRLRLNLGTGYDWTITGDTGPILAPGNSGITGASPVYTARQAGTLTLQITADPSCLKVQPPCERPSYFYTIPVTVR